MHQSPDTLRRRIGLAFLGIALGMLILGLTLLGSVLGKGFLFLCYWLVCILFTTLAFLNAALDLVIVRSRARREQAQLLKQALGKKKADP
jgi:hypothetical protein